MPCARTGTTSELSNCLLTDFPPHLPHLTHPPFLFQAGCGRGLTVSPSPAQVSASLGDTVTLLCSASSKPSICLWRTPYRAIYTVGGGRTWENGRLSSSPLATPLQCGLTIEGAEDRDAGVWQCEVGSVVGGDFTTTTASTTVTIRGQGTVCPELSYRGSVCVCVCLCVCAG